MINANVVGRICPTLGAGACRLPRHRHACAQYVRISLHRGVLLRLSNNMCRYDTSDSDYITRHGFQARPYLENAFRTARKHFEQIFVKETVGGRDGTVYHTNKLVVSICGTRL